MNNLIFESPLWKQRLPRIRSLTNKAITAAMTAENVDFKSNLSIVFANDAFVKDLNHTYRGKNKPTNILSFESDEEGYLGDMILAFETIVREAEEQGKTLADHLTHLLVHGLLHLLGYDHEQESDAEVMENKEIMILKGLGIENPY